MRKPQTREYWREQQRAYRARKTKENPRFVQSLNLKQKYGITPEQWDEMFSRQGGKCAICDESGKELHVDHDHQTGRVRSLLCSNCNRGIGCFLDDPDLLARASAYASKWKRYDD